MIETWKTRFDIGIFLFARDRNVKNSNRYFNLHAIEMWKIRINIFIFTRSKYQKLSDQCDLTLFFSSEYICVDRPRLHEERN